MEKTKNKKLNFKTMLATLGLLAVAVPGALSVVACKSNVVKSDQKIVLDEVIKVKSVQGAESDNEQNILSKILAVNNNITVQDVQVEKYSFKAADYSNSGSVIVRAKAAKFQGLVTIEIAEWSKTSLEDVIKVKSVQGAESDNEQNILSKILAVNNNITVQDVQVEKYSFKAADYSNSGSVIVRAKAAKFQGSVTIEIIKQTNFNKEAALKKIRDTKVNNWNDLNFWYKAWNDYFSFMRDELINRIFEFTSLELSSKDKMQAKIKNILHQILITDLERWSISKREYQSDSFAIFYNNFEVVKSLNQIKVEGSLSLNLIDPIDRSILGLQLMFFEDKVAYKVVD